MSLRETVGFFCHIKGYHVAPHLVNGHIDQSAMRLVGAPRVLHHIVTLLLGIVRQSDNSHRMSPAFPTDRVTMLQGTIDMCFERIQWNVQQTVVLPVVRNRHLHLFIIRRVWPVGQGEIFARGTYAMGKLQGVYFAPSIKTHLGVDNSWVASSGRTS